jgi:hypothetical protein
MKIYVKGYEMNEKEEEEEEEDDVDVEEVRVEEDKKEEENDEEDDVEEEDMMNEVKNGGGVEGGMQIRKAYPGKRMSPGLVQLGNHTTSDAPIWCGAWVVSEILFDEGGQPGPSQTRRKDPQM